MIRELGSENRLPGAPAQSSSEPAEAAWPMHTVETGERIYCIVSYIAKLEVTTPPGELIYKAMSLLGFSASRKRSWAQMRLATASWIGPTRKIIRSLSSRE